MSVGVGTPGSRHDRRRRETRERIANTALELFTERGYDAVTIAEIAAAADVAKQTVVNHFPAKEDLLLAWHRPVEADVIDLIDQLPLSTPLPEFLRAELPRLFAAPPDTPATGGRMTAVLGVIQNSPALQDALRLRGTRYTDDLASILEDRVPSDLGPVAARATAAFILATVTALVEEANTLRAKGTSQKSLKSALTESTRRATQILSTGLTQPPS